MGWCLCTAPQKSKAIGVKWCLLMGPLSELFYSPYSSLSLAECSPLALAKEKALNGSPETPGLGLQGCRL